MTTRQIAAALDMPQTTVSYQTKKLGISRPSPVGANPLQVGDRRPTSDGYIAVYMPDHPNTTCTGFILEHRLVMSQLLGRPLIDTEVVHHRDEDRQNNDPDNLKLYASPGQHSKEEHETLPTGYTDDELIAHLQKVAAQIGRSPRLADMTGLPHWSTYYNHFGSWLQAKEIAGV
jgi:hypothetical protein